MTFDTLSHKQNDFCLESMMQRPEHVSTSEEQIEEMQYKVFPNPTQGTFTFEQPIDQISQLSITDLTGKIVWHAPAEESRNTFSVGLPSGLYIVHIYNSVGVQKQLLKLMILK